MTDTTPTGPEPVPDDAKLAALQQQAKDREEAEARKEQVFAEMDEMQIDPDTGLPPNGDVITFMAEITSDQEILEAHSSMSGTPLSQYSASLRAAVIAHGRVQLFCEVRQQYLQERHNVTKTLDPIREMSDRMQMILDHFFPIDTPARMVFEREWEERRALNGERAWLAYQAQQGPRLAVPGKQGLIIPGSGR